MQYSMANNWKPESDFYVDKNMSMEKLEEALLKKQRVVGTIERYVNKERKFIVSLGNDLKGYIYVENLSIYSCFNEEGTFNAKVYALMGNKICAYVKNIKGQEIELDRKASMLDALKVAKSLDYIENAKILTKMQGNPTLFLDIGFGLYGRINPNELCSSHIKNSRDIGIYIGDTLKLKILSVENDYFNLSLRALSNNLNSSIDIGDIIVCVVLEPINDNGYFAYINDATSAILNSRLKYTIPYGTEVIARVRKKSDNGLHLSLLSYKENIK